MKNQNDLGQGQGHYFEGQILRNGQKIPNIPCFNSLGEQEYHHKYDLSCLNDADMA